MGHGLLRPPLPIFFVVVKIAFFFLNFKFVNNSTF